MRARLQALLTHLSETLSIEREREIETLHRDALTWRPVERLPLVLSYPAPAGEYQPYPNAETMDDPEKMLFNELVSAWGASICHRHQVGDDLPCTVRANFGTGIIASLFGGRIEQVEDNPPWVRPFESEAEFEAAMARDPLDFSQGWGPRVVERYQFYRDVLAEYPPLSSIIKRVLPDLQGPLDTIELLRGSEVYLDFYTQPERLHHALSQAATAQIAFARRLAPYLNDGPDGWSHQHGALVRGNILIRVDSAIMLSPKMYQEHIRPHDERVLRELGGGGLHSCGNIKHLASKYLDLPSVQCLDLGQPHLNNLEALYAQAKERGIPLLRVNVTESEPTSRAMLRRFPTGVSLFHTVASLGEARHVMNRWRQTH